MEKEGMKNKGDPIYDLLKKDHKEVKRLFEKILDKCEPSKEIFNQIVNALKPHMQGEEQYFYPKIKNGGEADFIANEAVVEHNAAKTLMNEICTTSTTSEMWLPKVKVLSEMIEHHIEEEEGELFEEAKKILEKEQEIEIGEKFSQLKSSSSKTDS